jgi:hypothetical protein
MDPVEDEYLLPEQKARQRIDAMLAASFPLIQMGGRVDD